MYNFFVHFILGMKQSSQNAYEKYVQNYALQLSWECAATVAHLKHIINFNYKHQIKGLFAHSSSLQPWFVLCTQNCTGVTNT
jgi:hypothetical protein